MTALTDLANAAPRLYISEPFNFQHITHTQPHHVHKMEKANPNDLVSEFSALRASQISRPELRGIKVKDIQREDLSRDALLPDCPSPLPTSPTGLPYHHSLRAQDRTPDSPYNATSPVTFSDYPRLMDNFSQPSAAYYSAQSSPTSPRSRISSSHPTPDLFTFHNDSLTDMTCESPIRAESPESLDYSTGTWNEGTYDLASPHAVTTDDRPDWNLHVPFSLVKTELEPVEEDDETEERRSLILSSTQPTTTSSPLLRTKRPFHGTGLYRSSDSCTKISQGYSPHPKSSAEEDPCSLSHRLLQEEEDVPNLLRRHRVLSTNFSECSIDDMLDDMPGRARFSRCYSVVPNDMDGFWDMASDAINCSYALGAEGDSNFDWYRSSFHGNDATPATAGAIRTSAVDVPSKSLSQEPPPESPSLSGMAINRSSSVYSSSPAPILPLQTFSSEADPPSAASTESSFDSIPEAVTPNETSESTMATRFPTLNCKEWSRPAYVVSSDVESHANPEELYQQMYTADYSHDVPFPIHNVGRIDGSTISNSPRSSRSPISKSSSQESFWVTQAAINARRPRNDGSVGSLPELMSSKNSRERFDSAVDQSADNPSESSPDGQQPMSAAQRRRSPNLAKDAAQNIILSKVKTAEEPLPLLLPAATRKRSISDTTHPFHDASSTLPPHQHPSATGRRMRSGSNASSHSTRGSRGSGNLLPPSPHMVFERGGNP